MLIVQHKSREFSVVFKVASDQGDGGDGVQDDDYHAADRQSVRRGEFEAVRGRKAFGLLRPKPPKGHRRYCKALRRPTGRMPRNRTGRLGGNCPRPLFGRSRLEKIISMRAFCLSRAGSNSPAPGLVRMTHLCPSSGNSIMFFLFIGRFCAPIKTTGVSAMKNLADFARRSSWSSTSPRRIFILWI